VNCCGRQGDGKSRRIGVFEGALGTVIAGFAPLQSWVVRSVLSTTYSLVYNAGFRRFLRIPDILIPVTINPNNPTPSKIG
jgi:hypothetical protein